MVCEVNPSHSVCQRTCVCVCVCVCMCVCVNRTELFVISVCVCVNRTDLCVICVCVYRECNEVDRYGKKEAGTGEHLTHFNNKINKHKWKAAAPHGRLPHTKHKLKSRPGPLSSSTVVTPHLTLPKLLRGTRDRWVAQVSFITNYSTGLAPFPRLSASLRSHGSRSRSVPTALGPAPLVTVRIQTLTSDLTLRLLTVFLYVLHCCRSSEPLIVVWMSVLSGRVLVKCFWKNSPSDEMSFVCSLSCCSKPVEICLSFTFWLWSRGMWFDVFSAHDDWGCVSISSLVQ